MIKIQYSYDVVDTGELVCKISDESTLAEPGPESEPAAEVKWTSGYAQTIENVKMTASKTPEPQTSVGPYTGNAGSGGA